MDIKDWDVAAANNTNAAPDGWPENMNYSQVNDTGRENMAVLARWFKDINGSLTTTGSANTYSITLNAGYSSYFDGMMFACQFNVANTGATTINVNGIGNRSIFDRNGDALHPGAIDTGSTYLVMHNATNFVFLGDVIPALNGERMYLDLDRDSYLQALTDDTVTITLGGTLQLTLAASGLTLANGGITIPQGGILYLDTDKDTFIYAPSDDVIRINTGGGNRVIITDTSVSFGQAVSVAGSFTVSASQEVRLNLPTSAGVSGTLWNDGGTVKVA